MQYIQNRCVLDCGLFLIFTLPNRTGTVRVSITFYLVKSSQHFFIEVDKIQKYFLMKTFWIFPSANQTLHFVLVALTKLGRDKQNDMQQIFDEAESQQR